jgi:para-aminobenzoate synthetase/4-amino-4-deoxychorismate lyase
MMLSFDAAPTFDKCLQTRRSRSTPLLWAAFYRKPDMLLTPEDLPHSKPSILDVEKDVSPREYRSAISKIKRLISDGDTYQVNFTFRISCPAPDDVEAFFLNLFRHHRPEHGAFVNTGSIRIASLSPELFVERRGRCIVSIPMKGTAGRMPDFDGDASTATALSLDPKNRAENLMITDMVRNDLGRICEAGTVKTTELFKVLTTPSVHQMVSEVRGRLREGCSLLETFKALFPPASITGAPKVRTMQIIKSMEKSPRGVYTGSIGCIAPGGDFSFNVAIRTATIRRGVLVAGVGGGIVADSSAESEMHEAELKSSFLKSQDGGFEIFETMLFERGRGYLWLDEHLDRMEKSQKYFLRNFDRKRIEAALSRLSRRLPHLARARISINENGRPSAKWSGIATKGWGKQKLSALISSKRTKSADIMLHHKTSMRRLYDDELKKAQTAGYDEVIFANERGEVTEGAISSVFAKTKNGWSTPPQSCGLLPGIWRNHEILRLDAKEQIIDIEELMNCNEVIIGNSVRGSAKVFLRNL